jgi:hypothetical protein
MYLGYSTQPWKIASLTYSTHSTVLYNISGISDKKFAYAENGIYTCIAWHGMHFENPDETRRLISSNHHRYVRDMYKRRVAGAVDLSSFLLSFFSDVALPVSDSRCRKGKEIPEEKPKKL